MNFLYFFYSYDFYSILFLLFLSYEFFSNIFRLLFRVFFFIVSNFLDFFFTILSWSNVESNSKLKLNMTFWKIYFACKNNTKYLKAQVINSV